MKRRHVLTGVGGIGVAALGGIALVGSAKADVEPGLFSVEDYDVDTNSGRLESLHVRDITVYAEWRGFDHPVERVEWTLEVTQDGRTEEVDTVDEDLSGDTYEGSASNEDVEDVDLVDRFGESAFEVAADEDTTENVSEDFDVEFSLTATVTDADGNDVPATVTGDSTVGITNLGADADSGGDGEFDGEPCEDQTETPTETPGSDGPEITTFENNGVSRGQIEWEIEAGDATVVSYTYIEDVVAFSEHTRDQQDDVDRAGVSLSGDSDIFPSGWDTVDAMLTVTDEDGNVDSDTLELES